MVTGGRGRWKPVKWLLDSDIVASSHFCCPTWCSTIHRAAMVRNRVKKQHKQRLFVFG